MLDNIPVHRAEDIPTSKEQVLWFFYVPFCSIICVAGIIGNILSLLIWRRLRPRSGVRNISTTTYFMILSAVDIGVLVMTVLVMVLPYADVSLFQSKTFAMFFSYVGHPLHFLLIFVSIYMVVAMSLDRVRLIFRPFSRYNKNQQRVYLTITVFTGLAFFLNIPSFFEFRPIQHNDGVWHLTEVRYLHRREFRNAVFVTHCIGVIVLPWLIMFVSNILLIFKSSSRIKNIRQMSNASTKDENDTDHRQMTKTLLVVSVVSLILLSIQCVARCITMFYYINNRMWPRIHFGRELGNLTLPLNSTLNFILFCLPGKRFRKELVKIVRKVFCRQSMSRVAPIAASTLNNTTSERANNPTGCSSKDREQKFVKFATSSTD